MMEFMTLSEVADYLRVTPKTVYRLLAKRRIPATLVGKRWRFDKASINGWLQTRSTEVKASILVVDDDELVRSLFKETLEELGHIVTERATAPEAVALVKTESFDLAFVDLMMPGMDGAALLHQMKVLKPNLPVTIITGYPDSEIMARALAYGPLGVMSKPFTGADILNAVNSYLHFGVTARP